MRKIPYTIKTSIQSNPYIGEDYRYSSTWHPIDYKPPLDEMVELRCEVRMLATFENDQWVISENEEDKKSWILGWRKI